MPVNARVPHDDVSALVPDEEQIGFDATRELVSAGHRDIVHLPITSPGCARDGRTACYLKAVAGVDDLHIIAAALVPALATVALPH